MKTLLSVLVFTFTMSVTAQPEEFDIVTSIGSDVKMMTEGPYKGQPNDIGTTLDYELMFFLDYKKFRIGTTFQSHQAIHFYKWAVLYDKKIKNFPVKNITTAIGPEFGLIKRTHRQNTHIDITNDWVQLGANLNFDYAISKPDMSFGVNYNIYRAEEELRNYGKDFRHDVTFNISVKFG